MKPATAMARMNACILVNSNQPENRYGQFAREILVSEGLTGFSLVDLADTPLPEFEEPDLILVTRTVLRRAQADTLLEAIRRGAGAVFLQPQQRVVEQLGLAVASSVIYPGTVRIRDDHGGTGLPLQTHLPIPRYVLPADRPDWLAVADALDSEWHESGHPAVAAAPCGRGRVTLFFYDLAEAVARIRFGNPDLSGYTTSATWPWPHALDLFEGHLDPRAAHLPQADLHSQLLARMLTGTAPFPLARLWYGLPRRKALVDSFHFWGALSPNPVWHSPAVMRAATRLLVRRGGRVLSLFWHSSEMLPGGSPNIPDQAAADALYQKTFNYLRWLRENYNVMGLTAAQLRGLAPSLHFGPRPAGKGDW